MSSDVNYHVFLSLFFISRRILKSFWTDRCFCKRPDRLVSPTSTVSKRRRAEFTILKHLLWHCRLFYMQVKPGDKVSAPNFPKAWFWTTKKEACNKKKNRGSSFRSSSRMLVTRHFLCIKKPANHSTNKHTGSVFICHSCNLDTNKVVVITADSHKASLAICILKPLDNHAEVPSSTNSPNLSGVRARGSLWRWLIPSKSS